MSKPSIDDHLRVMARLHPHIRHAAIAELLEENNLRLIEHIQPCMQPLSEEERRRLTDWGRYRLSFLRRGGRPADIPGKALHIAACTGIWREAILYLRRFSNVPDLPRLLDRSLQTHPAYAEPFRHTLQKLIQDRRIDEAWARPILTAVDLSRP